MYTIKRRDKLNWDKFNKILEDFPHTLTKGQYDFLVSFIEGKGHYSLLGDSGSGKSTVMLILKKYYEDEIIFAASTGSASQELPDDIGCGTGHSLFNIARDLAIESDWKKRPADILTKSSLIKIIVLDEGYCYNSQDLAMFQHQISKLNKHNKNRKSRNIRLVIVGDCLQRLPIVSEDMKPYLTKEYGHWLMFRSRIWREMSITTKVLTEVKRQGGDTPKDVWFRKALQVIRYGYEVHYDKVLEGFNKKFVGTDHSEDAIYIAPTNNKVNLYNEAYLNRNPNPKMVYTATFGKKYNKKNFPMDWEVTLAEGVKFITLVNNPDQGYYNGSVMTVTQLTSDGIYAEKPDGSTVFVGIHEFKEEEVYATEEVRNGVMQAVQKRKHVDSAYMIPVKLCAGFTFARCQGKTLDQEIVLDFGSSQDLWLYNKRGMEDFMVAGAFVGISRATSIDHVKLRNPLKKEHIKVCRESVKFWFESIDNNTYTC